MRWPRGSPLAKAFAQANSTLQVESSTILAEMTGKGVCVPTPERWNEEVRVDLRQLLKRVNLIRYKFFFLNGVRIKNKPISAIATILPRNDGVSNI